MTRILILIAFLLLATSCKSKKTISSGKADITVNSVSAIKSDSSVVRDLEKLTNVEEDEQEERVVESFVAIDSAGTTVIKPTTTTIRKNRNTKSNNSEKEILNKNFKTETSITVDSTAKSDFKVNEEIKAPSVVGEIANVLFPSWLKIAALIIGLISTALITRAAIKKSKSNGIPPA